MQSASSKEWRITQLPEVEGALVALDPRNGAIRALPGKLINDLFLHLENKEYFKAAEQAREVPKVSF